MTDKSANGGTKKRCSLHVGKGNARHNDRTFMANNPNPDNINKHMGIRLWTWDKPDFARLAHKDADYTNIPSISSAEQAYYDANYTQALGARNSRYQQQGHTERVKSMLDWYAKLKAPDETILQVGNMHNFDINPANNKLFADCVHDYLDWVHQWSAAHGDHVHVLSAALHYDESSPHAHIRTVYDYQGKDGLEPNIDKALAASGLQPPNPDKPIGRYNNRKMTWTAMQRDAWVSICRQHGLDIEDTPQRANDGKPLRSLSLTDYARKEDARRVEQAQDLDDRERQLDVRELQLVRREHQAEQLCADAISIIESAKLPNKSEQNAYFINALKSIKTADGRNAYIVYSEQQELQKRRLQPPKPPVKQKPLSGAAAARVLAESDYMQQHDGGVNDYSL